MPFKSLAQRRLFYALHRRGEMPMSTIKKWESKTPKKLPEKVMNKKAQATGALKGFGARMSKAWHNPKTLDKAGLGLLATVPAYHAAKGIQEKKPGEVATGAAELGGLGLLYRAVQKHK